MAIRSTGSDLACCLHIHFFQAQRLQPKLHGQQLLQQNRSAVPLPGRQLRMGNFPRDRGAVPPNPLLHLLSDSFLFGGALLQVLRKTYQPMRKVSGNEGSDQSVLSPVLLLDFYLLEFQPNARPLRVDAWVACAIRKPSLLYLRLHPLHNLCILVFCE